MLYRCENISNKLQALEIRGAAICVVIGLLVLSGILLAGCDSTEPEEQDCYVWNPMFPDTCTPYAYWHTDPAWNPENNQIAYVRSIIEEGQGHVGLYIYDLVAEEEHLVVNGATQMSPQAWSPDGEWIVFGNFRTLYKVRPDGTDLTQLTFERERFRPAWSPDGEWIAYDDATVGAPDQGTWIMRPDGSENQWLAHVNGTFQAWHPNGDRILTKGGTLPDFEYRIFINYLDPTILRDTLNPYPGPVGFGVLYNAMYAPDGQHIVYALDRTYNLNFDLNIWVMRSNGSGIRRLTQTGGTMPAWSPDGSTIAYANIYWREVVIWLMNPDGSNKRRMGPVYTPLEPPHETFEGMPMTP